MIRMRITIFSFSFPGFRTLTMRVKAMCGSCRKRSLGKGWLGKAEEISWYPEYIIDTEQPTASAASKVSLGKKPDLHKSSPKGERLRNRDLDFSLAALPSALFITHLNRKSSIQSSFTYIHIHITHPIIKRNPRISKAKAPSMPSTIYLIYLFLSLRTIVNHHRNIMTSSPNTALAIPAGTPR